MTTISVKIDGRDTLIARVYLEGPNSPLPEKLVELLVYVKLHNKPVIICMNSNAHSTFWGSPESDQNYLTNTAITWVWKIENLTFLCFYHYGRFEKVFKQKTFLERKAHELKEKESDETFPEKAKSMQWNRNEKNEENWKFVRKRLILITIRFTIIWLQRDSWKIRNDIVNRKNNVNKQSQSSTSRDSG